MEIEFINTLDLLPEFQPKPASSFVPDWYKKLHSYWGDEKKPLPDGGTSASVKRCMPVFDSITSGYIITSYVDVYISQREVIKHEPGKADVSEGFVPWYQWPSYLPIEFHPQQQAIGYVNQGTMPKHASYPKWINSWAIKTPPGYSCLFIPPMHRESVFSILPGVVDTDNYTNAINFPFYLHDWNFEGLIPAGTPIAQVIPFKRDSWTMKVTPKTEEEHANDLSKKLRSKYFDAYKSMFRQEKSYK